MKDPEKQLNGYFVAWARKVFGWSKFKRDALKSAEVRRGFYRCRVCGEETAKPKVDHVRPVIPTSAPWSGSWDEYRKGLFVGGDRLQVLCDRDHKKKTAQEAKERKKMRDTIRGKNE